MARKARHAEARARIRRRLHRCGSSVSGAHADDIEIGCGGTVLQLAESHPNARFYWVVLSAHGERRREAAESADHFLESAGAKTVALEDFRDGYFPYQGAEVKDCFEAAEVGGDTGSDPDPLPRRPSSGPPAGLRAHLEHLSRPPDPRIRDPEVRRRSRGSQRIRFTAAKYLRQEDLLHSRTLRIAAREGLVHGGDLPGDLRLRGIEAGSGSGYAEGFYGRKLSLRVGEAEK